MEVNGDKFDSARHDLLHTAQFMTRKVEEAEIAIQAVYNSLEVLKNVVLKDLSLHGQNLLNSIVTDSKKEEKTNGGE